jgi:deoxycytidylate deaminase
MSKQLFDWADLAFASKKPLNDLRGIFIAAPREISTSRFKQLLQIYLEEGNIILGIAKEPYVMGFEGQPQFRTLQAADIQDIVDRISRQPGLPHSVTILEYAHSDFKHILEKCTFKKVVLINGSWKYSFHTREPYYVLANKRILYDMVSPFVDEAEAKTYDVRLGPLIASAVPLPTPKEVLTEAEMLEAATQVSKYSYDYSFQTGVAVGRRTKSKKPNYEYITTTYNKVVPYQTFAMHHGAAREKHFSPPHDLNHYDTVHAETELILAAATEKLDLTDASVFINLLPCPTCSRLLVETPIKEVVYSADHSSGYAVAMLEAGGKTVRRIVTEI